MTQLENIQPDSRDATILPAPDREIDVREMFGIDIDMKCPAFSEADERVPDLDDQVDHIEDDVLPYARETGVGLIVYSPLEQGLLTGKVTAERQFSDADGRKKRPTFRPGNRELVNAVLARDVAPIAAAHGATLAQVALAWTLAQPGVTAFIAGARTVAQVEENAAAADLGLSAEEWSAIDRAFAGLKLDLEP